MTKNEPLEILAPSVDAQWRDDFVMELRLQGASGRAIADALVEVEAHCAESGRGAVDAFGPPVDYARALGLQGEYHWTRPQLVRTWVQLLLVTGGAWLTLEGAVSLVASEKATMTLGAVVSALTTVIVMIAAFVLGERLVRFVVEHMFLAGCAFALAMGVVVAVGLPFRGITLGSAPAAWVLASGITAFLACGVYSFLLRRSGKSLEDPLVTPVVRHGGRL